MAVATITRNGKRYVLVPESQYRRLGLGADEESGMPPLPKADADGNRPAVAFARSTIARRIIRDRRAAGLTQAELAARAGVREETINRLEKAKHIPGETTFAKIDRALKAAENSASKRPTAAGR
jgi:DNA-binding XRE family transcriptional regulator